MHAKAQCTGTYTYRETDNKDRETYKCETIQILINVTNIIVHVKAYASRSKGLLIYIRHMAIDIGTEEEDMQRRIPTVPPHIYNFTQPDVFSDSKWQEGKMDVN